MEYSHQPALVYEVMEFLKCGQNKVYVDGTIGLGGHSERILERIFPGGLLLGIDSDQEALDLAKQRLAKFKGCFKLFHDNFVNLKNILLRENIKEVNGMLFDLGVSSYQLDNSRRGFSFSADGPLDMRMNREDTTIAADLVNTLSYEELVQIFKKYGEERWSKKIARNIVKERLKKYISTTSDLVKIINSAIPLQIRRRQNREKVLMRTFQALRIAVNDELSILRKIISQAVSFLKPAGRICLISFHSLEDRIIKEEFKKLSSSCECPPDFPVCMCDKKPVVKILTSKPVVPGPEEVKNNSRIRSAKLRVAEKC